jgi:integrase
MRAARAHSDPLSRLIVELLARTGIRKSELLALTVDAVVQIGSAFWLRIPIGKLHNDRYIPLHPELKALRRFCCPIYSNTALSVDSAPLGISLAAGKTRSLELDDASPWISPRTGAGQLQRS